MSRILLIASCVLVSLHARVTVCAVDYPAAAVSVGERYPGNETNLPISLPNTSEANASNSLSGWEILTQPGKGTLNVSVGRNLVYTPSYYEEGADYFIWRAINDSNFSAETYTYRIDITAVNNPPEITPVSLHTMSFQENQRIVGNIVVFDPDPSLLDSNLVQPLSKQIWTLPFPHIQC